MVISVVVFSLLAAVLSDIVYSATVVMVVVVETVVDSRPLPCESCDIRHMILLSVSSLVIPSMNQPTPQVLASWCSI